MPEFFFAFLILIHIKWEQRSDSFLNFLYTLLPVLSMAVCDRYEECWWVVMMIWVLLAKMMKEKFEFLFLEAVCLIRSFIVQIVFPKNDLSEVSWWGIYGLRGRKTINCFCQTRTRAFHFHHLLCFNQTPRRRYSFWDFLDFPKIANDFKSWFYVRGFFNDTFGAQSVW